MTQYTLDAAASPDLAAIEHSIATLDPSAQLDSDVSGRIRISTLATQDELLTCLQEAGASDAKHHLARLPSDCCGGCGG